MKNCVALIGVIVENYASVDALNDILHNNRDVIIGRLGIPHKEKKISVMSIVLDTDTAKANKIAEDISMLDGIKVNMIISDSCSL
ncbi:MAG: hypothetical protein IKA30_02980 [Alphaproteobacteria bacterium]|nr:hypothetical protein [Alphaproteobacteria bacterium]